MKRHYMVQRFCRPSEKGWSPYAFGGGLRNGGVPDGVVARLSPIMTPDYMGAAEYEFGDLARAIENMARAEGGYERREVETPLGTVYLYCTPSQWQILKKDLVEFAREEDSDKAGRRLRRQSSSRDLTYLGRALRGDACGRNVAGGIAIKHECFMYSIDKEMRDRFADALLALGLV